MIIHPKDIISEFRKYKGAHPLKIMSLLAYDENCNIKTEDILLNAPLHNSINAIGTALSHLARVSEDGYYDMVRNKLAAPNGKNDYNLHNLISAFCELSVMNTFICRSSNPESFKYEDRLRDDSRKNVEFTIQMADYTFHVEVKSSNLVLEDQKIAKKLQEKGMVQMIDARIPNFEEIEENSTIPVMGSLDRRLFDYLDSANNKFKKTSNEKEINLLIICWDDRLQIPLMALKSPQHEGLLTDNSYQKDANGNPQTFQNVDCVLVNTTYELLKQFAAMILFLDFSPQFPVDPFFQVFSQNALIDYNLNEDRVYMIEDILQTKVTIVTEELADSLKPFSVATFKEGEENTIKFR